MQQEHETAEADALHRLEACVRGRVQGVGFRSFVRAQAHRLGVRGTVWNGPDGAVYVVAEGTRPALNMLLVALHEGPRVAHPAGVEAHWMMATGTVPASFEVEG